MYSIAWSPRWAQGCCCCEEGWTCAARFWCRKETSSKFVRTADWASRICRGEHGKEVRWGNGGKKQRRKGSLEFDEREQEGEGKE